MSLCTADRGLSLVKLEVDVHFLRTGRCEIAGEGVFGPDGFPDPVSTTSRLSTPREMQ
jgi:hypothetical protein